MFKQTLLIVLIVILSGCSTTPLNPSARAYSDAIFDQDIKTLQAYEDANLHQAAMDVIGARAQDVYNTKYPLHAAIDLERSQSAEFFIASGYHIDKLDYNEYTPLIVAVSNNSLTAARLLLKHDSDVSVIMPTLGYTALNLAVVRESAQMAKLLIDNGANVDYVSPTGSTPLFHAMRRYRPESVAVLLAAGANVHHIPRNGWSILHQALDCNQKISEENAAIVKQLIDAGANINLQLTSGQTPLSLAVTNNHFAELILLLAAGANPDIGDNKGQFPLALAVVQNNINMVNALIASGADINQRSRDGDTPLSIAASKNNSTLVGALISAGADVNLANKCNRAPIHRVVDNSVKQEFDGSDIAMQLINAGANIEKRLCNGLSPLMLASYHGRINEATLLLERGADVAAKNPTFSDKTALDFARENGYNKIAVLIEAYMKP